MCKSMHLCVCVCVCVDGGLDAGILLRSLDLIYFIFFPISVHISADVRTHSLHPPLDKRT